MKKSSLSFRAGVLAVGNGMAAVVRLIVAAVLARVLTEAELGTYRQTYLLYTITLPLLGLGLPSALLYFLPRHADRKRGVLVESVSVLAVAGACFSVMLFLGADFVALQFRNPQLATSVRWFALFPLFSLPMLAVAPSLIAENRPTWVAIYSVSGGILRMVLVLGTVLWLARTPLMAIQASVAAAALMFVPGMVLMLRAVRGGTFAVTRSGILEQIRYAVPLGVGSMIGTIHKEMDKVIVSSITSADEYSIFHSGAMELPFIPLLTGSAAAVMVPEIARRFAEGKYSEALDIFRSSATKCATILAPIAGWFFVSAPWVMTWLYGPTYQDSTPIFRIYLLLIPLRVAFFGPLFQAAGRSDLVMKRSMIGFVGNVVLTIVLAIKFGPIGAAVGTVVSILLFAYLYCVFAAANLYQCSVWRLLPLASLSRRFVPVIVIVAVLFLISNMMAWEQNLDQLGWGVLSVVYAVAVVCAYRILGIVSFGDLTSRLLRRG